MLKPINEITTDEHALVAGFVSGDDRRRLALLLRFFEGQTKRYVARQTGLPASTIEGLAKRFGPVYTQWRAQRPAAA